MQLFHGHFKLFLFRQCEGSSIALTTHMDTKDNMELCAFDELFKRNIGETYPIQRLHSEQSSARDIQKMLPKGDEKPPRIFVPSRTDVLIDLVQHKFLVYDHERKTLGKRQD